MTTYFNKKDLIAFGKYLLSDERTKKISEKNSDIPLSERIIEVHHADVENFLESIKKAD